MYIFALHTAKMQVSAHKKAKKGEKCRIVYIFALHTAKMQVSAHKKAKEGEKCVLQYKKEGKQLN